jgi:hypothetical protein
MSCRHFRSLVENLTSSSKLQCLFSSLVHVISRGKLCHHWSKASCKSSQVPVALFLFACFWILCYESLFIILIGDQIQKIEENCKNKLLIMLHCIVGSSIFHIFAIPFSCPLQVVVEAF